MLSAISFFACLQVIASIFVVCGESKASSSLLGFTKPPTQLQNLACQKRILLHSHHQTSNRVRVGRCRFEIKAGAYKRLPHRSLPALNMGEKDQRQEVEMEALEAEISDLEERLSDESEDDTVAAPKAKSAKKFSFRELAFSVISKLKWSPQAKVDRS
jgi:hypothetical protein